MVLSYNLSAATKKLAPCASKLIASSSNCVMVYILFIGICLSIKQWPPIRQTQQGCSPKMCSWSDWKNPEDDEKSYTGFIDSVSEQET